MTVEFINFLVRWGHLLFGITWIGMLYYFNFVQGGYFKEATAEALSDAKAKLAPSALWWFRWGAMATIVTGLILGYLNGYIHDALALGALNDFEVPKNIAIGIGMWLGIIMWFNVWFVIWPNQKKALGIVEADAETKAASARTAMLFSRTNTMLSIPMLFAMVSAQNLY